VAHTRPRPRTWAYAQALLMPLKRCNSRPTGPFVASPFVLDAPWTGVCALFRIATGRHGRCTARADPCHLSVVRYSELFAYCILAIRVWNWLIDLAGSESGWNPESGCWLLVTTLPAPRPPAMATREELGRTGAASTPNPYQYRAL
jgi:hypothetical protein